ncbi:MAG: PEP-CTERM sorting domain-containing protein [Phycisphaerae bacterium]|nr:PEP-CTERM sorting domain-containing protein [Phycisphaerae bacterium]
MWRGLVVVAAVAVFVGSAVATPINYGDFTGVTMRYQQISEDSGTDPLPLYNSPTLVGDTLQFNNLSFYSSSSGNAADTTDGNLMGWIEAKVGSVIQSIAFDEYGDVSLNGSPLKWGYASVTNTIFVQVHEIDRVAVAPFTFTIDMVMTPSDGDWTLMDDGYGSWDWEGHLLADVTQALRDKGYATGYATKLYFEMDNTLNTSSETGTSAYIAKKLTDGLKVTASVEVPEPITVLLMGLGLGLLRVRRG